MLSILNVFRRVWWPYQTRLGRVAGLSGYHDVTLHPHAEQLEGLVLYRFDAPLFFANVRSFREELRRIAAADPAPRWIVLAAEPMTDVDTTAADVLEELDEELSARGVRLVLAELKDPVRGKVERYELDHPLPEDRYFRTIEDAVTAYRESHPAARWYPVPGPSRDHQD